MKISEKNFFIHKDNYYSFTFQILPSDSLFQSWQRSTFWDPWISSKSFWRSSRSSNPSAHTPIQRRLYPFIRRIGISTEDITKNGRWKAVLWRFKSWRSIVCPNKGRQCNHAGCGTHLHSGQNKKATLWLWLGKSKLLLYIYGF